MYESLKDLARKKIANLYVDPLCFFGHLFGAVDVDGEGGEVERDVAHKVLLKLELDLARAVEHKEDWRVRVFQQFPTGGKKIS